MKWGVFMGRRTSGKRPPSTLRRAFGTVLAAFVLMSYFTPQAAALRSLPDQMQVTLGQGQQLMLGFPFSVQVEKGPIQVLSSSDERLGEKTASQVTLKADATGAAELTLNLMGLFPYKKVQVSVEPETVLVPGGQAIGVALKTAGVLVVGTSDLGGTAGASPARLAGIRPGDVILSVAGEKVKDSSHLSALVAQNGGTPINIAVQRDNEEITVALTPKLDSATNSYRMGVWVRDSTAGVGTLSFYDPATGAYGALGHAITDGDTGQPLTVSEGNILAADVVDVQKGQKGAPGELKGSFLREKRLLGNITKNTILGIYGSCDQPMTNSLYPEGVPVGLRGTVHTGPATILSSVDEDGVKAYEVEITQVNRQSTPAQKSMVLKVTDPALLEKTGGIVQGMSGSPILQDGRLIGAVTHVFVNDPTQGYGLYIEWMMDKAGLSNAA